MPEGPLSQYRAMVSAGELEPDPSQLLAAEKLQLLANRLNVYEPPARTDIFSFFTRRRGEVPKGLYLFGGVGRGKTMLGSVLCNDRLREEASGALSRIHGRRARAYRTGAQTPRG